MKRAIMMRLVVVEIYSKEIATVIMKHDKYRNGISEFYLRNIQQNYEMS
jgi:hypothetical protein